jgi:hypothetical protein
MDPNVLDDLARVSAEFLNAMGEAQAMMDAGEFGDPLREVLRYCSELLDIANDYMSGPDVLEAAKGPLLEMTQRLQRVRSLLDSSA